jgi:hypothetical protein
MRRAALRPGNEVLMPNDSPWWRRPGVHLRHDAHRWIRHDAARFVRPGFDPADVFPTLARKAKPVQAPTLDDELAAEIDAERRVLDAINAELDEVNAEMARWRALDAKYSPAQPRIPAGNPRGGQWTDRDGGQSTGQGTGQDAAQGDLASLTQPMGNVDIGDVSGSSEVGDLFQIKPSDTRVEGVQVGGDVIRVCIAGGISSWKDGLGIKNYKITYDCAGGRSFDRSYIGNYPGIVRDPNR